MNISSDCHFHNASKEYFWSKKIQIFLIWCPKYYLELKVQPEIEIWNGMVSDIHMFAFSFGM